MENIVIERLKLQSLIITVNMHKEIWNGFNMKRLRGTETRYSHVHLVSTHKHAYRFWLKDKFKVKKNVIEIVVTALYGINLFTYNCLLSALYFYLKWFFFFVNRNRNVPRVKVMSHSYHWECQHWFQSIRFVLIHTHEAFPAVDGGAPNSDGADSVRGGWEKPSWLETSGRL